MNKVNKIISDMALMKGFPSSYIEDHTKKITRKYFQEVLSKFDNQLKIYLRELSKNVR